jgi:cell division protein FtsB
MPIVEEVIPILEDLAGTSCRLYEKIMATYEQLNRDMAQLSATQLRRYQEELEYLIQETTAIDVEIANYKIPHANYSANLKAMLQNRADLIFAVHAKNKEITRNATNLQSHIRHEIQNSTKNRVAMKGYKPATVGQKCLINTTY